MALLDPLRVARRLGWLDPRQIAASSAAVARWGPTLASMYAAAASRHGDRVAVIDHLGGSTYRQLDQRSTELAAGFRSIGMRAGDHLGVLCTNHRDFVETSVAAAKAGLPTVFLNTGFAAPQLGAVIEREGITGLVCDADLASVADASGYQGPLVVADVHAAAPSGPHRTLADVRGLAPSTRLPPSLPVAPILLTSGTTGTPKGARRGRRPAGLASAFGLLDRIPYRDGDVSVIPTPLFHAWGLAQLTIAAATASTAVLVRRFAPDETLAAVDHERATVLAVVPVMLQRILAAELDGYDTSTLRIVASSGSALPGPLAIEWMDRYGDNLYNVYGSTEVGQATLATPDDLRAAPGTAGRVVAGSTVEVVDDDGDPLPAGKNGLIVVGNDGQFSEYTGGGTKARVRGLMSSGDIGHFDTAGRLFVTGRADDMIVSGGENVFPAEVEDVLLASPEITDAAVVGVDDDEFGQRLAAFVVRRPGSTIGADAVRTLVTSQLARHKVPRDVEFVDDLPRTTTGKLLRRDLGG